METKTPNTREEQDQAHNPSQRNIDREFQHIADNNTFDDMMNSNGLGQELKDMEQRVGKEAGNADNGSSNNAPDASKNISNAKSSEQAWNTDVSAGNKSAKQKQGFGSRVKGIFKKQLPTALVGGGLLTGGGLLGFFGLTLMPVTIAEHFTNDTNDVNDSSQHKSLNLIGKQLGGDARKKLSICNKAISIRCKFNSMDKDLVAKYEEKGFKFGEKQVSTDGKRVMFTSIEFPTGEVAHNVQELTAILKNSAVANAAFNAVYSLKNSLFLVGNFFKGVLTSLNLTKQKKIEGKNKEEADKSFEDSAKGEKGTVSTESVAKQAGDNASEEAKKDAQAATDAGNDTSRQINEAIAKGSKLKSLSLKITNALAIPQLACLTYNMSSFIATMAKIKKAMRFAAFAMIFLTMASAIKANASTDAEVTKGMSILAPSTYPQKVEDPETGEMIDNPNIGKNALDAEAYKVVAYGDQINLTGLATRFFIASGFLGVLEKIVTWLNDNIGKETIKLTCKAVNNKVVQIISFLAAPIFSAVILGITSVLPIEEWAAELVNVAIDAAAGVDLTTGVTGVDAGNVIFIGAAVILGTTAMKFGLKPGKLAAIKANIAANNELNQQDIAMKTYEASKTPFDINNRYSFLGAMATSLADYMPSIQQPFISTIGKTFAAIPNSLTMLTNNTKAAYSMPTANYSETRFSQCKDEVYATLKDKMDPDMFCAVRYVPHEYVDSDVVLDYMESNNQIDEVSGSPKPDTYLDKYMKYCVNREDPWGSTSVAAEEQTDEATWYTGEKCMDDTTENKMSSEYNGYLISQTNQDEAGSGSTATSAYSDDPGKAMADLSTPQALSLGMAYAMGGLSQ
ncbi:MAG TPA: hypothetical protein VFH06_01195 [Candidatus Saccharimonadales bacterium]|nr:hypothetical protein [Candidatus Saccharimonadales bacterium]